MKSEEIRSRFLEFFKARGHKIIPSASLVTSDEKGITNPTLFNTAGMQPLVPYLLGKPHPLGKRLANVQKCLRTVDIDDVGDKTHATFFEMMGNWSLGDYFKEKAIEWSYEFLTDKKEGLGYNEETGLGIKPEQLYVTVFEGDANASRDDEAAEIWRGIFENKGIKGERIFYMPADKNWWEAGDNGPCGPDTEMYYDVENKFDGKGITKEEFIKADDARDVVEVWNDVFMQYEKKDGKIIGKLPNPSVDTGAGLERLAMTLQGVDNIYETDLFMPIMKKINEYSQNFDIKSARIVADHTRAAIFLIADDVIPDNTDRGYVLRKIIRRAVRHADRIGFSKYLNNNSGPFMLYGLIDSIISVYKGAYFNFEDKSVEKDKLTKITKELGQEEQKFRQTLMRGIKILNTELSVKNYIEGKPIENIPDVTNGYTPPHPTGKFFFDIYQNHGFPIELSFEELENRGRKLSVKEKASITEEFKNEMQKHQELSRAGAEKKFKGGLADTSDKVIQYHTATHLLHQALHDVLGDNANQKGSNITAERLRFDFTHGTKMTSEEIKKVEEIVNQKIREALPVTQVVLSREEAEKTGARHFFGEKYGDQVSVYYIGSSLEDAYSKEFCGGPHVKNTNELKGRFKITKEEAVAMGIRRVKAVLE